MHLHLLPSQWLIAGIGVLMLIIIEGAVIGGIRDFWRWKSYGMAWIGVMFLFIVPALATALVLNACGH
jgi:hypothetical protein